MKISEIIFESDEEHSAALQDTGFWGKQGAGCVFKAKDTGRFLIAHRSRWVQEPNTWGTWGGAIDANENPKDAMLREIKEETGYSGEIQLQHLWTFEHESGFRYYNFLAIVPTEFEPILDWENQGFAWVEKGQWPTPLHPGFEALLAHTNL